jgi:diguanylate cyclase (GGDEF)-like protein/PAS domain S-box-containing protein
MSASARGTETQTPDSIRADAYRALVLGSPDGVALVVAGRIVLANLALARLLGAADAAALEGGSVLELVDPDRQEAFAERIQAALQKSDRGAFAEERLVRRDASTVDVEIAVVPYPGVGEPAVQVAVRDISDRKRSEERMTALAYRDALTGLPNRRLFNDRLGIALAQARRYRHRLAVVFVDLDRFKPVNDTLGHAAGDELLQLVAERLSACVRLGDTVARLAGDEFTLLLPGIHYVEDVSKVSQKLTEAMRRPFRLRGQEVHVSASGGISIYPDDAQDAEALLANADIAMYRAKQHGRDNFQMYAPSMTQKALEQGVLAEKLRGALDANQMALYYQPTLDLATGRIVGAEALLRWQHPELGLIFPKDFLSLADFTGLILSLGPWALEQACAQARDWQRRGSRDVFVAVNLSAYELQQSDLLGHVERALGKTGLDPSSLHLEIPEGYAMQDLERTIEKLRSLKALGVEITIDGFGSGFSSLARLSRLPIDALKMDLSFVRGATTDPDDASLVTAVIAVAHSLKLEVIAQGVETEAQVALLRSLQCDGVQGYIWSPPVPADQCERLLVKGVIPLQAAPRSAVGP